MKGHRFRIGSILFDTERRELSLGGQRIRLTGKEVTILKLLVASYPEYLSPEEILAKAWPPGTSVGGHAVPVHLSTLKRKLCGQIESQRGIGYRLTNLTEIPEREYTFEDAWKGAGKVGADVFDEPFKANVVLTFAGPGAVFANLVLANHFAQDRNKLLEMPIYLALQRDWPSSPRKKRLPALVGYTPVPGEEVVILVPDALIELANHIPKPFKLAVIDDVVMSGAVLACLRPYLQKALGRSAQIRFVCFVCFKPMGEVATVREPDYAAEKSMTTDFTLPWGSPFWFGKKLFAEPNK